MQAMVSRCSCAHSLDEIGVEHELLMLMLKEDPEERITAEQALEHEYFEGLSAREMVEEGILVVDGPNEEEEQEQNQEEQNDEVEEIEGVE